MCVESQAGVERPQIQYLTGLLNYSNMVGSKHTKGEVMRLSTVGRYALRAMVDLALYATGGPVPRYEIAARQEVSLPQATLLQSGVESSQGQASAQFAESCREREHLG